MNIEHLLVDDLEVNLKNNSFFKSIFDQIFSNGREISKTKLLTW